MSYEDLFTARLRSITITPKMLDAESALPQRLESLLQLRVPTEWSDANW